MIKACINLLLVLSLFYTVAGQTTVFYTVAGQTSVDSLIRELELTQVDTKRALLHAELSNAYVFSKPDSGFYYASEGLRLSRRIDFENGIASNLFQLSIYFRVTGASYRAMQYATEALSIFKAISNHEGVIFCTNMLAWLAQDQKDYRMAIEHAFEAMRLSEKHKNYWIKYAYSSLGASYEHLNKLDSALLYAEKAKAIPERYTWNLIVLGRIHFRMNHDSLAIKHYRQAVAENTLSKDSSDIYIGMAKVFSKKRQTDSAIYYSKEALQIATAGNFLFEVQQASEMLAEIYKLKYQGDSTLKYMQLNTDAKDSLFSQEKMNQFQSFAFNEKLRQQEMESEKMLYRSRIRTNVLLIVIGFFLILAVLLYRNNKQKQKAKIKIEKAYDDLKSTQQQLIQSEKMASLGELTAGIAHEIQNPLNFVNNFSEVNKELLMEMKEEMDKGNLDDAKAIASDIIENQEKIDHHGKRADAIVKNMLQHSRTGSGKKEPTDINALADEYLRLAYYGMRAKDKSFNVTTKTEFDNSIGKINVVPQEIGRVILNLINNAFYVVTEKKKQLPPSLKGEQQMTFNDYEPTVTVITRRVGSPLAAARTSTDGDRGKPDSYRVEIRVADNGNGIPQKVLDKIFQPFFTTKPTGEGTGLGLSLSYDIVKAHGGELKVESRQGEGATFIIQLPII